jgi:hypothetical protein
LTGGIIVRPCSLHEALGIVQREEFIDLSLRQLPDRSNFQLTQNRLELFGHLLPVFDRNPPTISFPFRQNELLSEDQNWPENDQRKLRCQKELKRCRLWHFCVYPLADPALHAWRAFIEIPSVGNGIFWDIIIQFPMDYPYSSPNLRFLTIPEGLTCEYVSEITGRISTANLKHYHEKMHVVTFLIEVGRFNFQGEPINKDKLFATPYRTDRPIPLPDIRFLGILNVDNPIPHAERGRGPLPRTLPIYSQISGRKLTTDDCSTNTDILIHHDEEILIHA